MPAKANKRRPVAKEYNVEIPGSHPPCNYEHCGDTARFLRTRGSHIYECCGEDHRTTEWLGRDMFAKGGERYGQLPPEDFDKVKIRRAKKVTLLEHIAVALRAEETCFFCGTDAFEPPKQQRVVREWLQKFRPSLYSRLLERFKLNDGTDMAAVPAEWPKILKEKHADFYEEIDQELTFSKIEADHLIQARLLELISPDRKVGITAKMLEFGGRELGVPTCQKCNRGRHRAGQEPPEKIMRRWSAYYFDGNTLAAKADPRYRSIEALATCAYGIDQDLQRLRRAKTNAEGA